ASDWRFRSGLRLHQPTKRFFIENFYTQFLRFFQLAARFVAREHIIGFLAYAPAHSAAALDNYFCNFIAWLAQRARDYPGRSADRRIALFPRLNRWLHARLFQTCDQVASVRFLKKLMTTGADHWSHVRNPL